MNANEMQSALYPPKSYFLALICAGIGGLFYLIGWKPLTLLLFLVGGGIYMIGERLKAEAKTIVPPTQGEVTDDRKSV